MVRSNFLQEERLQKKVSFYPAQTADRRKSQEERADHP
ncbi:hypothetical protein bcere0022_12700 [Bacillus cereus Rock3-44]|nr:hypothetical protein bcere0022_12700 [Bacillus cereus Rock3-44]